MAPDEVEELNTTFADHHAGLAERARAASITTGPAIARGKMVAT
jgi:hypothetical protein